MIPANYIGSEEARAAWQVISHGRLSGFLGGELRGGPQVVRLENLWAEKFHVKHAIACNSATSGLLASCMACGMNREMTSPWEVLVPSFTMSATAAVPKFLGARLAFGDCDPVYFQLDDHLWLDWPTRLRGFDAVIVTNLFGHPANLRTIKRLCDNEGVYLIEDNAQGILAKEGSSYAGTVGDIGVFSLNVHKSIHAGEGGMCVTDDAGLAERLRRCINHGELAGAADVGLNLRMTEYTAAIAIEQLAKLERITALNIEQARAISHIARRWEWLTPPAERRGASHVYYCWAAKADRRALDRDLLVKALAAEGYPFVAGYADPLYRLPAFGQAAAKCPVAERLHDEEMVLFENTLYWLSSKQLMGLEDALIKINHHIKRLQTP
jgi:dTDP-4-amino-4,6-dideoxygalactose transaminase